MSRLVTNPYDKLRALEQKPQPEFKLYKLGATMRFSEEQMFNAMSWQDDAYNRKGDEYTVSPTAEDWAKYHLAKAGLLALQNYEPTLGLEEVDVPIPRPEVHYRFTETNDEWLARCRALRQETS